MASLARYVGLMALGLGLSLWPMPSPRRALAPHDTVEALDLQGLTQYGFVTRRTPVTFKLVVGEDLAEADGTLKGLGEIAAIDKAAYFRQPGHARSLEGPHRFVDSVAFPIGTHQRINRCNLTLVLEGAIRSNRVRCDSLTDNGVTRFQFGAKLSPGVYAARLESSGNVSNAVTPYLQQSSTTGEWWVLPYPVAGARERAHLPSSLVQVRTVADPRLCGHDTQPSRPVGPAHDAPAVALVLGVWVDGRCRRDHHAPVLRPRRDRSHRHVLHRGDQGSGSREGVLLRRSAARDARQRFFSPAPGSAAGSRPVSACDRWKLRQLRETALVLREGERGTLGPRPRRPERPRAPVVGATVERVPAAWGFGAVAVVFGLKSAESLIVIAATSGILPTQIPTVTNDFPLLLVGLFGVAWLGTLVDEGRSRRTVVGGVVVFMLLLLGSWIDRAWPAGLPLLGAVVLFVGRRSARDGETRQSDSMGPLLAGGGAFVCALLASVGGVLLLARVSAPITWKLPGLLGLDDDLSLISGLGHASVMDGLSALWYHMQSVFGVYVWGHSAYSPDVYSLLGAVWLVCSLLGFAGSVRRLPSLWTATATGAVFGVILGCQLMVVLAIAKQGPPEIYAAPPVVTRTCRSDGAYVPGRPSRTRAPCRPHRHLPRDVRLAVGPGDLRPAAVLHRRSVVTAPPHPATLDDAGGAATPPPHVPVPEGATSYRFGCWRRGRRPPGPVGSRSARHTVVVRTIMALALLKGLVLVWLIPPFQAPDEYGHYDYALFLSKVNPVAFLRGDAVQTRRLSDIHYTTRELIAVVEATGMRPHMDDAIVVRHRPSFLDARRRVSVLPTEDTAETLYRVPTLNNVFNYPPLYYGLLGVVLRLLDALGLDPVSKDYAARVCSVLLLLATLAIAARLLGALRLPGSVGAITLFAIACHPELSMMSASVQPDMLSLLLVTVALWLLQRSLVHLSPAVACGFGVSLGLLLLTKVHTVPPLAFGALATLGLRAGRRAVPLGSAASATFWAGSTALLVGGWWYVRSRGTFDNWLGLVEWQTMSDVSPSFGENLAVWFRYALPMTFRSYWGVWGWFDYGLPDWTLPILAAVSVMPALLLVLRFRIAVGHWSWGRGAARVRRSVPRLWLFAVVLTLGAYVVEMLYIAGVMGMVHAQGRQWLAFALPQMLYLCAPIAMFTATGVYLDGSVCPTSAATVQGGGPVRHGSSRVRCGRHPCRGACRCLHRSAHAGLAGFLRRGVRRRGKGLHLRQFGSRRRAEARWRRHIPLSGAGEFCARRAVRPDAGDGDRAHRGGQDSELTRQATRSALFRRCHCRAGCRHARHRGRRAPAGDHRWRYGPRRQLDSARGNRL